MEVNADADSGAGHPSSRDDDCNAKYSSEALRLPQEQVSMLREVFDMLDSDGVGTIDVNNLYDSLQAVNRTLSKEDAINLLKELGENDDGRMYFKDFLRAMTNTNSKSRLVQTTRSKTRKPIFISNCKQQLFVTAITKFAVNHSHGEIERFYNAKMRQGPHVLSYYIAVARVIGMTEKKIQQEIRRVQKKYKKTNSPYSKPLPFISTAVKRKKKRTKKKKRKNNVIVSEKPQTNSVSESSEVDNKKSGKTAKDEKKTVNFNADVRTTTKTKEETEKKINEERKKSPTPDAKKKRCQSRGGKDNRPVSPGTSSLTESSMKKDWIKLDRKTSLFPALKISLAKNQKGERNFTYNDLSVIREKLRESVKKYYASLRKEFVQQAWKQWHEVRAEDIRPVKMLERFRSVYKAYSPHKEKDIFVIAPWIPGPKYTSHRPRSAVPRPYSCPPTVTRRNIGSAVANRRPYSGCVGK